MWEAARFMFRVFREKAVLRKSVEEISSLQQHRLQRLVAIARNKSPYYQERLRGLDAERFQLSDLPTLTKTEMMANFDRFLTVTGLRQAELERYMADAARLGEWYQGRYALSRTSGTQGLKAVIVQDRGLMELLYALQVARGARLRTTPVHFLQRFFQRARVALITIGQGFYPSASAIAYAPAALDCFVDRLWIKHFEPVEELVHRLNEFQPHVLIAYASVLEILAREALAGRLRISEKKLRQVMNMSEPLSTGARHLLRQAFGREVIDSYGAGECMFLSIGCLRGHGMHVQADWAILEVVDCREHPVPPGQPGDHVLVTNLANTIQPFIRYRLDDIVTLSPEPCPCGNPLPLISKVEGRTDEVVWIRTPTGYQAVHPYVFVDFLDEYPPLGWYQVLQVERNRFKLRAASAPGRHINTQELHAVIRNGLERFGLADAVHVDLELTDDVSPDKTSGKLKRITSLVGPPKERAGSRLATQRS